MFGENLVTYVPPDPHWEDTWLVVFGQPDDCRGKLLSGWGLTLEIEVLRPEQQALCQS